MADKYQNSDGLGRTLLVGAALVIGALLLVTLHASWRRARRAEQRPQIQATVRLLGTADLCLSFSSRWLRHPAVTEPGAPFSDGPALLDVDPAGMLVSPPRRLLSVGSSRPMTRRRPSP